MVRRCLKIPVHIICMVTTEREKEKTIKIFMAYVFLFLVEDASDICFRSPVPSLVEMIT